MKKRIFLKWLILVPIAFSLLFGCGGKGKDIKKIEGDPEKLYREGLTLFNKRDYPEALNKFEELKSSFPDSPPYTLWAELKVGDCHFLQKQYVEAIAAYEEFKKIHPGHEEIPYVQYQIGMSYYNQMLTLDRDQTPTKKALSSFEYLIANHPPNIFTEKAKEKINTCKKRLADHEFYIGNFYYKQGRFEAAASRFEGLLEKFPKEPDEDKTLYLLGKSYLELDRSEKAEVAFTKIVTDYPQGRHFKEARAILDKGMAGEKVSVRKTKESKKKGGIEEIEPEKVPVVKFEEEKKQPVSLNEKKKIDSKKEEEERLVSLPVAVESVKAIPPEGETKKPNLPSAVEPIREDRTEALSSPKQEGKPGEGEQITAISSSQAPSKGKEEVREKTPLETPLAKLVDKSQPIDITSDKVEAFWKENLIIFKGNVIARQKDIVIYADSIEAVTIEDGKGIDRVTAGGNVKVQQGLRVATCQKAVFYNLEQKVVLTGDPRVSEGENIVSGEEITFDIEKNRVEVKGGTSGRGKAKIQPGGEIEKLK